MIYILCYGDSNTWGRKPIEDARFPLDERWPGVLRQQLGSGYWVIEEGLNGRTTVWVADIDSDRYLVSERLVKIGLGFDGVVEILEGLAEGERVVVRGNESLRPGQQVRIRE